MPDTKEFWLPGLDSELAALRLTAEMIENLSALSGVGYKKIGAILPSLAAPNPAPKSFRARSQSSISNFCIEDILGRMPPYLRHWPSQEACCAC